MKRRTKEPGPEPAGDIMTMQDVAAYLSCHYITIYRLVRRGALPVFRLGGDYRFRRADIDEWMAQQHVRPAGEAPPAKGRQKRT
jgi:excisionase family DNA binding protein